MSTNLTDPCNDGFFDIVDALTKTDPINLSRLWLTTELLFVPTTLSQN